MDHALAAQLNRNYRYQRYVYDLTRAYYLLGRDRLIASLDPPRDGTVLEVGCGTARNLMRAAELYPRAELHGIDLSRMMLETAERNLAAFGWRGRVRLALADATEFRPQALFGQATYDRIYFSYALSMIPGWQQALTHAHGLLAPRGELHIVDFGSGERLPAMFNRALLAWLARFHVTPRHDLPLVLRRLADDKGGAVLVGQLYRGYAIGAVLKRA